MCRLHHLDTFEAFCMYNEFQRHYSDPRRFNPANPPDCVRLLLSCSEQRQLLLFNKLFRAPLCVHQAKVFCFESRDDREQLCVVKVHQDTALATISFQTSEGSPSCQLDTSDLGGLAKVTSTPGTQWMLKVVDRHHVKIGNSANGKFARARTKISLSQKL
jgi:hypothetical protein